MGVTLPAQLLGPKLELELPAFADDVQLQITNNTTGRALHLNLGASWDGDDLVIDFFEKTVTDQAGIDRSALIDSDARDLFDDAVGEAFAFGEENDLQVRAQEVAVQTVSGPLSPDTVADDSAYGSAPWSSPSNAVSSNNTYTTVNFTAEISHYLKATDFDFAIPGGAEINGIKVEIERKAGTPNRVYDSRVRIVKGGVVGSSERKVGGYWPTSDAIKSYGSSSDLWGETWTDSDINATTFGLVIAAARVPPGFISAYIDHVKISVYYTVASAPSAYGAEATWQWQEAFV